MPVGAARLIRALVSNRLIISRIVTTVVVFPVPGPPEGIVSFRVIAIKAASFCLEKSTPKTSSKVSLSSRFASSFFHCDAIKNHSCDGTLKLEILVKVKFSVEDNERTFFGRTTHCWVREQLLLVVWIVCQRETWMVVKEPFGTEGLRTF